MKRPPFEVYTAPQRDLFDAQRGAKPAPDQPLAKHADADVRFVDKDPRDLFINGRRLDAYLVDAGQTLALYLRSFLATLDYADLVASYEPKGRQPYAPWAMLGIFLYGLFKGVTSLRDLEALARTDLGCMWVSGGICPDHSVLGRFLVRHQAVLTDAFFEQITTRILRETSGGVACLAIDGTIIQAAASRLRTLKREAAKAAAERAIAEARAAGCEQEAVELERVLAGAEPNAEPDAEPDEDDLPGDEHPGEDQPAPSDEQDRPTPSQRRDAKRRRATVEAAAVAEERAARRRSKGRDADSVRVSPTEPEAVNLKHKDGSVAPGYGVSIAANEQRIIVAKDAHTTSESEQVGGLLDQAERVGDAPVEQALADAGYHNGHVASLAVERDIDLLCPPDSAARGRKSTGKGKFVKAEFDYDEDDDCYRCPAGHSLRPVERYKGNETNKPYVLYGTKACASCPLRDRCTTAKLGRRITRYPDDEVKDALRAVMAQPAAQEAYRHRRIAMVEPPFSVLRYRQGATRFRRRGLGGVRLELSLHAMAYNLRRWATLTGRSGRRAGPRGRPASRRGDNAPHAPHAALRRLVARSRATITQALCCQPAWRLSAALRA